MYRYRDRIIWLILLLVFCTGIFSIVSLVISLTSVSGTQEESTTPPMAPVAHPGGTNRRRQMACLSNQSQLVQDSNQWTNIYFNVNTMSSPNWHHHLGSDAITSDFDGINTFLLYYSVQVDVASPSDVVVVATASSVRTRETPRLRRQQMTHQNVTLPVCHGCQLRYGIRATLQKQGAGPLQEVEGSLTVAIQSERFLSKQVLLTGVTRGDILRLQFVSSCPLLALTPTPPFITPPDQQNHYSPSATLVIV